MREPNSARGATFSVARAAGHRTGEDRETAADRNLWQPSGVADDSKIPKGRVRRSAKLGSIVGVQGARYAGTKATNVARSEEGGKERLEQRHLETAMKMVGALGQMKGAAMKLGQFASFIDTEFIPEEYREIYQEQLAKLRTDAPPMPWEKVEKVLLEEYDGEPVSELFAEFETEAFAAASIGQVHRAQLLDGRDVAVKIQYPGIAEALEADLRNAGTLVRLARAAGPRARRQGDRRGAPRAGHGGARLRVRGAEPAHLLPRLPRPPVRLRAGSGDPALAAPRARHRAGRGDRLRGDQGAAARGAQPLRRDRLPRQLRLDLPPAALQRRPPPRQLHPDGRRPRRLPRLRDDEEARPRADRARAASLRRRLPRRPRGLPRGPARARLRQEALEARRRAADGAHEGGRRLVRGRPRDRNHAPGG